MESSPVKEPLVSGEHLTGAKLRSVRARFAELLANPRDAAALGSIVLRSDQLQAVRRVETQLARDGGCLLANDVGTGKTYVALAATRRWRNPLIVVPASLRPTWHDAVRRASVRGTIVSHESLSRGVSPPGDFDGIVVDESHRFRPTSRRHALLARLVARAPVLLLSATPLQNRTRELAAQVALFIGDSAYRLDASALARFVVRGAPLADSVLPRVAPPRWLSVRADDGPVLRAILALPPPPRAVDSGDGGALLTISLVRAWASSRAALLATARRRRQTLSAIQQCFDEGRVPTRSELRSWRGGGGVQLGFAALLATTRFERESAAALARALDAERRALDTLLASLAESDDPDVARVAALRSVRAAHCGGAIIAFSESASTIRAYFGALRSDAGVGMLTAREGRITTGRIPRAELLARFAPRSQGARQPAAHERVTLLLATDLLSEGVNLQDASIVVHLDLPWNPARLAQRLGRVRRPGGADEVFSYVMTPPAEASLLLRAESRLRAKLARAERTIGRGLDVMPAFDSSPSAAPPHASIGHDPSNAELHGQLDARLTAWRREHSAPDRRASPRCIWAAARCDTRGWVAALNDGRLVARIHSRAENERVADTTDDVRTLARALELADGPPRIATDDEAAAALAQLSEYVENEWTNRCCGLTTAPPLRRDVQRRLDRVLSATPRHRRRAMLSSAARLRRLLDSPLPLGVERELALHALENPAAAGEEWLSRAVALATAAPGRASDALGAAPTAPSALILFGP
ncbi:MAG: helicase-related protein [Gemmatimonadaceae bacterium]